jgi:excisionase family DNA binding protein
MAEYLSITQVATLLGCDRTTIWKAVREGHLPALRLRGAYRIPREALDALTYRPKRVARVGERHGGAA